MRILVRKLLLAFATIAVPSAHAEGDMQPIGSFAIDRTEVYSDNQDAMSASIRMRMRGCILV